MRTDAWEFARKRGPLAFATDSRAGHWQRTSNAWFGSLVDSFVAGDAWAFIVSLAHHDTLPGSGADALRYADPHDARRNLPMSQTPDTPASFEAALSELENIVARMEGGQLPLKDALAAYQRGAQLLAFCQQELKGAQQQVEILEQGVLKAFDPGNADA